MQTPQLLFKRPLPSKQQHPCYCFLNPQVLSTNDVLSVKLILCHWLPGSQAENTGVSFNFFQGFYV